MQQLWLRVIAAMSWAKSSNHATFDTEGLLAVYALLAAAVNSTVVAGKNLTVGSTVSCRLRA
jgi:hypothetical protein